MSASATNASKKARGAFYTPQAVSRFLAAWAIGSPTERVLEPSCGEASFLLAAAELLAPRDRLPALFDVDEPQIVGIEIDKAAADEAKRLLETCAARSEVISGDFFDHQPSGDFDAVLGNPPFVRYHGFSGDARHKGLRAALAGGVNLSGLTSSWAPFLVHAARFLKPSGKLGMVLPAELLSVSYAAPIRSFLLERFAKIQIVLFEHLLFEDALENVVLLMAEGTGGCDHIDVVQVRDAEDLPPNGSIRVETASLGTEKWTATLVGPEVWDTFRGVAESSLCEPLGDWGEVYLGAVTGENRFFCISDADAVEQGLDRADLLPISPPGSRHLSGLTFDRKRWRGLCEQGKCGWLFYPSDGRLGGPAQRYADKGKGDGVAERYKCRNRSPWWRVPVVDIPDLFLTYMAHDRPRLVTNAAKVYHLNSLYGIRLRHGRTATGRSLLPLASLNTITILGAEFHGRTYGGGMLKLEPRESKRMPMPSLPTVRSQADALKAVRPQVAYEVERGNVARAVAIVDSVLWDKKTVSAEDLALLQRARSAMFSRRTERGRTRAKREEH